MSHQITRSKTRYPSIIEVAVVASVFVFLLSILSPKTALFPRQYYKGRDQFHWISQLHSNDPLGKQDSVQALRAMLRDTTEPIVLQQILLSIGEGGANARDALPEIDKLLCHRSEIVRDAAKRAKLRISPPPEE